MQWRSVLFGTLLSGCLLSCGDDTDLPPLRFETEHFRYHARPDVDVCDGLGMWLEHHYRTVGDALRARLPVGDKFDIYVFSDQNDLAKNACFDEAYGCSQGRAVYQFVPFMPHELIHAYVELVADPPVSFNEALAYVLGCGPGVEARELERSAETVEAALTTTALGELTPLERERAQSATNGFVRFLIDRFGLDRVMDFASSLGRNAARSGIELAFARTFDLALGDALAEWVGGPPQTEAGICLSIAECATERLSSAGTVELSPACVYGTTAVGFLPWSVIRTLSAEDELGVVVEAQTLTSVAIRGCGAPLLPPRGDLLVPEPGRRQELWSSVGPGKHWLLAGASNSDFTVRVTTGPPLFGERCSSAPARSIAPETSSVRVFGSLSGAADDEPADGAPDLAATLDLAESRRATIFRFEGGAFLCPEGCPDGTSACSEGSISSDLDAGASTRLVVQGETGYALRIDFEP